MIYTLCLNPALDVTLTVPNLKVDEVNRAMAVRKDAGGKGINVARTIAALGARATSFAYLAGSSGDTIKEILCDVENLELIALPAAGQTRTNYKIVDPTLHTYTDINEPGPTLGKADLKSLIQKLEELLEEGDSVVVSGSSPQGVSDEDFIDILKTIQNIGTDIFLDVDGTKLQSALPVCPTAIKPNKAEIEALLGREIDTKEDALDAAQELVDAGISYVLVSLGKDGAVCVSPTKKFVMEAIPVEVKSTVGAGDAMLAAFVLAHSKGMELWECLALSVAASAAAVMQEGTQAASVDLVEELLSKVTLEEVSE